MKTSELTGAALDWAVAKCEGLDMYFDMDEKCAFDDEGYSFEPSASWGQGGPIIEREKINIEFDPDVPQWFASYDRGEVVCGYSGLMPLIAAMRCYVASKLGDEIELPEELNQ